MANSNDDVFAGKQNHKKDGRKHHKRGFNENQDIQTQRHSRINFKNYVRNLTEQDAIDDDEEDYSYLIK